MKKIIIFSLVFYLFSISLFSQGKINEIGVTYEISEIELKGSKSEMQESLFKSLKMEMLISKDKQKVSLNMMKGMLLLDNYIFPDTKKMSSYMKMMGQKIELIGLDSMYRYSIDHPESNQAEIIESAKKTGKKKKVLDYECVEYVSKYKKDGKVYTSSSYITNQINIDKNIWKAASMANSMMPSLPSNEGLTGFPLEFEIDSDLYKMRLSAVNIDKKIPENAFKLPEGEYQKVDYRALGNKGASN